MDFTNEVLNTIIEKMDYNRLYSGYLYAMSLDDSLLGIDRYKKRSDRILNCMDYWLWDIYHNNKVMDLKKVNRCMDSRFCPNCRKFSLASCIHNFSPAFKQLLNDGYYPYLLTLTVPNVKGDCLRDTIKNMNKSFRKFFQKFSQPVGSNLNGFKHRIIQFDACLKVLEVTYNSKLNTYHPHFHIIIFSKEYDESIFQKNILGPFSKKRSSYCYYSSLDVHIMKIWKMCYDNIRFSDKTYFSMSDNWYDLYLCDIKEMDERGIYEVLKYTFKDSDIINYNVFKDLFIALDGQRIRQGHGLLYNLKVEEVEEGEKQDIEFYLEKDKKEIPMANIATEIKILISTYHDYRKISRFKAYEDFSKLD